MTATELLQRLDSVRPRGPGRWVARCSAHADNSPSLSIREGERGILLRCFAGCSAGEVVAALGLELKDLFIDSPLPRGSRPTRKPPRPDRRQVAFVLELHALALQERAEKTVQAAGALDTTTWTDADFDAAMDAVGRAYSDLERAGVLLDVADSQREKAYQEGR